MTNSNADFYWILDGFHERDASGLCLKNLRVTLIFYRITLASVFYSNSFYAALFL